MPHCDNSLLDSRVEDEVKDKILALLNVPLDMRHNIDCYSQNILFEFKYDADISNNPSILAQAIYYYNKLLNFGDSLPPFIALIDKNECAIFQSKQFENIYSDDSLFVEGRPSDPSQVVIDAVKPMINSLYFYSTYENDEELNEIIDVLKDLLRRKKIIPSKINPRNVKKAYQGYVRSLGDYLLDRSSSKGVFEFRADAIGKAEISNTSIFSDEYTIDFRFDNGLRRVEHINKTAYDSYWKQWLRIDNDEDANLVFSSIYDLLGMADRRTKGQFYTPKTLAKLAWESIENVLGKNFWLDGSWRIWDCCAGTGNLEFDIIPESAMQYLYLSTLDIEEVDQLNDKFPLAKKVFVFDFLNNSFNQLSSQMKDEINNQNIKWLFLINPPYGEAQGVSGIESGATATSLQAIMKNRNLGDASREMFAQFLFNIEEHFKNRYFMGLFSKAKYMSSKKFGVFRKFWQPIYKGGFVVNAREHFQCDGDWPLLFSLYDRLERIQYDNDFWVNNKHEYTILNAKCEAVGTKNFQIYDPSRNFRNFLEIEDQAKELKLPLLKSGIALSSSKNQYCEPYVSSNFMATMVLVGAEFQQRNWCYLASGIPNTNHNNVYITRNNYKNILSAFALYKAPYYSWIRDRDFIKSPSRTLTDEEQSDCILYALLSSFNNTATYRFSTGEIIKNYLNPLDETIFDFSNCSDAGKEAYNEMRNYLENIVNYKNIQTPFGKGAFLGFYQYRMPSDASHDQCYGFEYPQSFKDAIENLRKKIADLSEEICLD